MPKAAPHRWLRRLREVNILWLAAALAVCGVTCVLALRHNNLNMVRLRDKVFQADKNNGDVEKALRDLRVYVLGHMNTNLSSGPFAVKPPIQLKYRYDRLVKAEEDRVAAINAQVYTDAQNFCEQQFPHGLSGSGRVPCIKDYVSSHGTNPQPIPDALYKFDFISPRWTPDLAGWSLVATVMAGALLVLRQVSDWLLRRQLRE